jgi:hypothetical protein
MAIIATNKGGESNYTLIPAGNHIARCYSMVELGTLTETILGQEKQVHKIRLTFELPDELRVFNADKGEQPCVISKEFTLSMNEKSNLRAFLKSWRGKDFTEEEAASFDVTKLLGVPCLLNIIHKPSKKDPSRIYDEIASATPLMKNMTCPPQVNSNFEFSLQEWNPNHFELLPEFLKEKVRSSKEYKAMFAPAAPVSNTAHLATKNEDAYHYAKKEVAPHHEGQDDSDLPF